MGDALDLFGTFDTGKFIKNMFTPTYRAGHAFNSIIPYSYDNKKKTALTYLSALSSNRNPVIDSEKLRNNPLFKKWARVYGEGAIEQWKNYPNLPSSINIGDATKWVGDRKEDAWRLYLGLPQKYNTYEKTGKNTYKYSNDVLSSYYPNVRITGKQKVDYIGYNHAGLHQGFSQTTQLSPYELSKMKEKPEGLMRIVDKWDLQPFSRKKSKFYNNTSLGKRLKRWDAEKLLGGNSFILDQYIPFIQYEPTRAIIDTRRSMDNYFNEFQKIQDEYKLFGIDPNDYHF